MSVGQTDFRSRSVQPIYNKGQYIIRSRRDFVIANGLFVNTTSVGFRYPQSATYKQQSSMLSAIGKSALSSAPDLSNPIKSDKKEHENVHGKTGSSDTLHHDTSSEPIRQKRSQSLLVETIHGRSRRYFYQTNNNKLFSQWMWGDNEAEFDLKYQVNQGVESKQTGFGIFNMNNLRFMSKTLYSKLQSTFHSWLLPAGYPSSVHSCYVSFSLWQFVEAVCNSICHVLCSQAMLSSVGLPTDAVSTAGGAVAIKWVVKDGLANFAKLGFTKYFSHMFDFRPKSWGIICEALYGVGIVFELSTAIAATSGYAALFIPLAAAGTCLQIFVHIFMYSILSFQMDLYHDLSIVICQWLFHFFI
jgi:hypothetical protein